MEQTALKVFISHSSDRKLYVLSIMQLYSNIV